MLPVARLVVAVVLSQTVKDLCMLLQFFHFHKNTYRQYPPAGNKNNH